IIDSQSVATTESGGPRGLDAAKRIQGRKRHIGTDTQGLLLASRVHQANLQDSHGAGPLRTSPPRALPLRHVLPARVSAGPTLGAVPLLNSLAKALPLRHILADRVYRGPKLLAALADCGPWRIDIVQRPHGTKGFQLLPRRWVVERTFAWFGRNRRLAKDHER